MNSTSLRHMRRLWFLLVLGVLVLLLASCGGAATGTPTPIPASVVRPQQPTPAYSTAQPQFRLEQATTTPRFSATIAPAATLPPNADQLRAELLKAMLMNLPPSAMGIATGGVTILDAPGGTALESLPAGGSLTVTGRSQDGNWLAVYTNEAVTGWVAAGALRLYGDDDLETVTNALSPAPVATMIAEAMQPAGLPMADVIATRAAAPLAPAPQVQQPTADAATSSSDTISGTDTGVALVGTVQTQGDLNLRAAPAADAAIMAQLPAASPLIALARTATGDWLQVRTPAGDGWVDAQYVALEGDLATLPARAE